MGQAIPYVVASTANAASLLFSAKILSVHAPYVRVPQTAIVALAVEDLASENLSTSIQLQPTAPACDLAGEDGGSRRRGPIR